MGNFSKVLKISLPVFLFVVTFYLLSQNIDKPFFGEHDWNGVRYGNIARNYLLYGLVGSSLGQIENSGPVVGQPIYFTHYPPLLPILIALSYNFFSISEGSTRLIPIIFTSGLIVVIYLLSTELFDRKVGVFAALLALSTPLILYFGKTPVHEPLVVFFSTLAFYFLLLFKRTNLLKFKLLFFILCILAIMSSWAGYFFVLGVITTSFISHDKILIKLVKPLIVLSVTLFIIHILHAYLLTGNLFGGNLIESFLQRTSLSEKIQPEDFNLYSYILRIRIWLSNLFTNVLLVFNVIGLYFLIKEKNNLQPLCILGIFAFTYHLIFLNAAFIHNYLVFYFLPFIVTTAAWGLNESLVKLNLSKYSYFILVIFIFTIAISGQDRLQDLNNSNADQQAVSIGKFINKSSSFDETIKVMPKKVEYRSEYFLKFYSDRKIIFTDNCNDQDKLVINVTEESFKFGRCSL